MVKMKVKGPGSSRNHIRVWTVGGQHSKKQRYYIADKDLSSQSYGFSHSRV